MARRKRRSEPIAGVLFVVLILAGIAVKILQSVGMVLLGAGITAGAALLVWKLFRPVQLRKQATLKLHAPIEKHMDQLVRQRAKLVRSDPYGKLLLDDWNKHIRYFVSQHLVPLLTQRELSALAGRVSLDAIVSERVEAVAKHRPAFEAFSETLTPVEFEQFCAEQLRVAGWRAEVTRRSRDQGVDVVAEKAGVRVVLQCKLYSSPVGNKAVQEIVAGRGHEQAHYGAVVTNNRYTPAAEQLASTNGVLLLHHSDLARLEAILGDRSSSRVPDSTVR